MKAQGTSSFSKYLPFKSLELGAQLGDIGLCSNNVSAFHQNPLVRPYVDLASEAWKSGFVLNGRLVLPAFLRDGQQHPTPIIPGPHGDMGDAPHGFQVNELQNTLEDQFLLRGGSGALWLNSLERQGATAGAPSQPEHDRAMPGSSLKLAPGTEKVSLLGRDCLASYAIAPSTRDVFEQKEMSLSEFVTISVPELVLTNGLGRPVAQLGKGLPFLGKNRYLPRLHTRVALDDYPGDWQAHPYCHRPLLLMYELERDLTEAEMQLLEDEWAKRGKPRSARDSFGLSLTFCRQNENPRPADSTLAAWLPFPFIDRACG